MNVGDTIKERYGEDHYKEIGRLGGQARVPKGFGSHKTDSNGLTGPERAKIAGAEGGRASKRRKVGWKLHL